MPIPAHLFVILGGTGDLAARKLLPALSHVLSDGAPCEVLAVGTKQFDDDSYRSWAAEQLEAAGVTETGDWCGRLHYQRIERNGFDLGAVASRIEDLETEFDLAGNRCFYLALPPQLFEPALRSIGEHRLLETDGWHRLVIEKPFGTDAATAAHLDEVVHAAADESDVFRIDHYLGKETVRNLLAFRFANPIFEASWNRDRVEEVVITVAETVGVGSRARYYDRAGVVRDMVQNHLTQVLSLVAMEPPVELVADAIRDEKVKVLRAIRRVDRIEYGQYDGYRDEEGIPDDSTTPTWVEAEVHVDCWRWQGVPFILRTGKMLPERKSKVEIRYRKPPVTLLEPEGREPRGNVLTVTLQPDEAFDLSFEVKEPGEAMRLRRTKMGFDYADEFPPFGDAYETLLADVLSGDQTLFVRADEVAESWRIWEPLLDPTDPPTEYEPGTWPS